MRNKMFLWHLRWGGNIIQLLQVEKPRHGYWIFQCLELVLPWEEERELKGPEYLKVQPWPSSALLHCTEESGQPWPSLSNFVSPELLLPGILLFLKSTADISIGDTHTVLPRALWIWVRTVQASFSKTESVESTYLWAAYIWTGHRCNPG